jgi:hypothetical protein
VRALPLSVAGNIKLHHLHLSLLGDIIASNGKNTKNIANRIQKGHGKITEIMTILEKTPLGPHFFKTALLLRESLFLNSSLTNADIWVGFTSEEVKQFEDLDSILLRKFQEKSTYSFNAMVKRKSIEYALFSYLEKKENHSKLDNLF